MTTAILILVIVNLIWSFLLYGATIHQVQKLGDLVNANTTEALTLLFNADKVKEQAKQGESVSVEDL